MPSRSKKSSRKNADVKLKKVNWLGIDHEAVEKHFEGKPRFVNYMNVGYNGDLVVAVYHTDNPNRKKGHREFVLLWMNPDGVLMVSGMELEEIEKHAIVTGSLCLDCNKALYSLNRHDFHSCGCKNDMFVDGGKDYLRAGAKKLARTRHVTINLLTDKITVDTKPPKRLGSVDG